MTINQKSRESIKTLVAAFPVALIVGCATTFPQRREIEQMQTSLDKSSLLTQ